MPPVFLVKFRQHHLPLNFAHWGIFLPTVPYQGLPTWGVLYHARKHYTSCFPLQRDTEYERILNYNLSQSNSLWDAYPLTNVDLTDTQIAFACSQVSQNRVFNFIRQNCQEWVKEVIRCLVQVGLVNGGVFEEISLQGWVTLDENCGDCVRSSLPCNRCRRRS